ncbi:hypothetical protein [Pontimicrobium sp. SW4]|uniref:General secretion pathway protein n=1 Tax=Pontimicrobium sp. SW4 TaxID=3153519 RepID=A0AAU7BQF8_9FLAO
MLPIKKVVSHFLYGHLFCSLEHSSQNGNDVIYGLILKKNKNEIDIHSNIEEKNVDAISKKLKNGQHVSLIINNDQVLTKSIANNDLDDIKLIYSAFPNIKIDDIYYEILRQQSVSYISICRKSYVEGLVQEYAILSINIINIFLGNSIISSILKHIESDKILTSNAIISTRNSKIENVQKITEEKTITYNVNGIKSSSRELLSLAGALQTIVNQKITSSNLNILKEFQINRFKEIRFFKLFSSSAIAFFLVVLLINFLFYNNYYTKVNSLSLISNSNQTLQQKIITLTNEVDEIQKITEDLLAISNSKSSYFINDIIKSIPETILFSNLDYHPLSKKIQKNKLIEVDSESIFLTGESIHSDNFTKWINDLERKKWINTITVSDYNDITNSKANFKVIIKMKNEL